MSSATLYLGQVVPHGLSAGTVTLDVNPQNCTVQVPQGDEVFFGRSQSALLTRSGPVSVPVQGGLYDPLREYWKQEWSPAVSTQAVTTRDFVITLNRTEELRAEEEEDDRPSGYAYNMALELLREAAKALKMDFPRASASVGPGRGLRITWSSGTREIRLICGGSPTNKTYIYRESGSEHAVDYSVNGSRLAQHLHWFLHAF